MSVILPFRCAKSFQVTIAVKCSVRAYKKVPNTWFYTYGIFLDSMSPFMYPMANNLPSIP